MKLLDAAANPGGLSAGWRTKEGRAVEAGMKGFWYQARRALGVARILELAHHSQAGSLWTCVAHSGGTACLHPILHAGPACALCHTASIHHATLQTSSHATSSRGRQQAA